MRSTLTEKQKAMVEEMMPYVRYALSLVTYIPPHLRDEAYSVACEALCRSAALYDGVRASFKTYAVQSMRKSVLKFLIREKAYSDSFNTGMDLTLEQAEDEYVSNNALDRLLTRDMLKEIYQSRILDDEMREAFLLLSDGKNMQEISEYLRIPLPSLRNRVTKARQRIIRSGNWDVPKKKRHKLA